MKNQNTTIKNNNESSVNQQARLLMAGSRQRQYNRNAQVLERLASEIGIK
jgi:hypothetical protein